MLKNAKLLCTLFVICVMSGMLTIAPVPTKAATVISYPLPSCYTTSSLYTVKADSTNIPVIDGTTTFTNYNYCNFSFSGTTTITITASESISTYSISPLHLGITGTKNGNTLTFTLSSSQYLIVKINSLKDLIIAADALESSIPPSSGAGIYNVKDYGADSTGTNMATTAVQSAIDEANARGGGTVYVPAGVYKCGNLVLKSNVSVYLAGGAVIRGSGNPNDYVNHYYKDSLDLNGTWFIYTATNASNVKIYGRGTIDGNGHYMRNTNNYLNNLVVPLQCSNFTIDGVILRDSGLWGLIPTRSDNITIKNTKHFNNNDLDYENDAIDIQECQNVSVTHVIAVSEDDTYSTKTWQETTDIAEKWPGSPEELINVTFDDCVGWSRCATYKVGFGNFQKQSYITFKNSTSYRSMKAIAIIHRYGAPITEAVTFENIDIEGFWPRSGNGSKWLEISAVGGGSINNTILKNINVRNVGGSPSIVKGASSSTMVNSVSFSDIKVNGSTATTLAAMNVTDTNSYISDVSFKTVNDNFNSNNIGSNPTGWIVTESNGAVDVVAEPSTTDKAVKVSSTSTTSSVIADRSFALKSGIVNVQAKVVPYQTGWKCAPYVMDGSGNTAVGVVFDGGYIKAYNGSTLTNVQGITYGTAYKIKIVLNTDTDKYDLYVDDVLKASQWSFRTAVTSVSKVRFSIGNVTGSFNFDNVGVY